MIQDEDKYMEVVVVLASAVGTFLSQLNRQSSQIPIPIPIPILILILISGRKASSSD